MKTRAVVVVALVAHATAALGQQGNPLPVPPEAKGRVVSNPAVYERESAFKRKYSDEAQRRQDLEREMAELRAKLDRQDSSGADPAAAGSTAGRTATVLPAGKTGSGSGGLPGVSASSLRMEAPVPVPPPGMPGTTPKTPRPPVKSAIIRTTEFPGEEGPPGPGEQPLVFAVSAAALEQAALGRETAVPLGSYVKARVLTGVEANTVEAYPVLLQLDYAFVGPNRTRIDLSHCFMIAKAKANLSTERVMGETQQISCVRSNNEIVTRAAKGYVAGEDSTFGITGELISHQGQVFLAAVLASLAKSAGEAVAMSQTTTQIATGGVGGVATAQNITGDKALYVAGKSVSEPASMIAQWYLRYAESLVPSIAIGSGRDVWIVLLDTVRVPELDAAYEGSGG